VSDDRDEAELLALLEDEYARAILAATSAKPMPVDTLSDRCDASESTIYRRVDRLKEHDLVEEQTEFDPGGHHYSVYASRLRGVNVTFEDGEWAVELDRRPASEEDVADRFTRMWQDL
jgi:DNA-binding transcriptional ArsR family regulator